MNSLSISHLVIHLLRTVEDVYHNAHGSAEIFCGLSLPCSSRPSWGATHRQVE